MCGEKMKEYTIKNSVYKIRYHDFEGKGIPILFIHGLGCSGSYDYPNVAVQTELLHNRRIMIDLLGAGYSDKPIHFNYTISEHAKYLCDFIEDLEIEQFILFGHSIGGAVALALANLCEEKVVNIILSEANLDSGGGLTSSAIAAFGINEFVKTGFDKIIEENKKFHNERWVASFSLWLPQAAYLLSRSAVDGQEPTWREILYSLKCPKTFIYGEKSLPDPDMQILIENNIHIEIIQNAGHSMAWENPRGLAVAIKNAIV